MKISQQHISQVKWNNIEKERGEIGNGKRRKGRLEREKRREEIGVYERSAPLTYQVKEL